MPGVVKLDVELSKTWSQNSSSGNLTLVPMFLTINIDQISPKCNAKFAVLFLIV